MPAGGGAYVSPQLDIPVAPFQETSRGQRMERVAWAIEQVAQDTKDLHPFGANPSRHLTVIKGLPMSCPQVGHRSAPPDESIPYHAGALKPLEPHAIKGYTYDTMVDGKPLPDEHQIFQTWKDWGGGWHGGGALRRP